MPSKLRERAPKVVTRGWMDVQNRRALDKSTPIQEGQEYTFNWDLQPEDYVFPAGHRIGLVVLSTDMKTMLPGGVNSGGCSLSRVPM